MSTPIGSEYGLPGNRQGLVPYDGIAGDGLVPYDPAVTVPQGYEVVWDPQTVKRPAPGRVPPPSAPPRRGPSAPIKKGKK